METINRGSLAEKDEQIIPLLEGFKATKKTIITSTKGKSIANFNIDENNVLYIEKGDYKSFTFQMLPEEGTTIIQNLLLSLQRDGAYKAFLISYDLTSEERIDLLEGKQVDLTEKATYEVIYFESTDFLTEYESREGKRCYKLVLVKSCGCNVYILKEVNCEGGSGGGANGGSNGDSGGTSFGGTNYGENSGSGDPFGGGSYGGGSSNSNSFNVPSGGGGNNYGNCIDCGDDMTSFMLLYNAQFEIKTKLGITDSSREGIWLNTKATNSELVAIYNFLVENNYSAQTKAFAKEAMKALAEDGEVDFEEQIIDRLTGKAECVYEKLQKLSSGFKNTIKKFDGEFPVSHLKLIMEDLASNERARTIPPGHSLNPNPYLILIQINNDTSVSGVNYRPNLLTAKTIIHEVIHAEMFRKLLSLSNNNGNIDVSKLNTMLKNGDYPGMLDYYTRYGLNNFQHQQMAAHYRQTIADVLKDFDNNQHSNQFYMDLAWEGLNHSNIVAWKDAISQAERTRINNSIASYIAQNKNQTCK